MMANKFALILLLFGTIGCFAEEDITGNHYISIHSKIGEFFIRRTKSNSTLTKCDSCTTTNASANAVNETWSTSSAATGPDTAIDSAHILINNGTDVVVDDPCSCYDCTDCNIAECINNCNISGCNTTGCNANNMTISNDTYSITTPNAMAAIQIKGTEKNLSTVQIGAIIVFSMSLVGTIVFVGYKLYRRKYSHFNMNLADDANPANRPEFPTFEL